MTGPSLLGELRQASATAPSLSRGFGLTLLLALLGTAGHLVVPVVLQRVIDDQLLAAGAIDVPSVAWSTGSAALALVGATVLSRTALVRMMRATADGLAELRTATFDHAHRLSILRLEGERRGTLVSRVTSDVAAITEFLEWGGVEMVVGAAQILLAVAVMLVYDWRLALLVTGGAALYAVLLAVFQRVLRRAHDQVRVRVGESLAAVGETIVGLPTIRAYGAETRSLQRVDGALERQFRAQFRAGALGAVMFSSAELFAATITAGVVAAGLLLGQGGGLTPGTLVAFLFLVTLFVDPVQTLVEVMDQAQSAAAGIRRVLAVLDTPVEVADPGEAGETPPPGPLSVAVEGLSFAYPAGERVLHDLSFSLAAGRRCVVVGETGCGKTTLSKLLVRLMDPDVGRILLGGVPVDRIPSAELRRRVAFVPQEGFLFGGTVAENLRYGRPDASDDELLQAVADLGLDGWLAGLPDGLHTDVGERGGRLSSGERQLVALVRAWLVRPDLLVLDEATSAVDPALEVQLRLAVDRLIAGRTSVTVAHRMSTARLADEILVLDAGRLVERGSHAELLAAHGGYASMWQDWVRTTGSGGGRGPSTVG